MGYNPKSMDADYEDSIMGFLGMKVLPENEDEKTVYAEMPVNERTRQPYGVLAGGASIAFAECLAGYGSWRLIAEDEIPVGTTVTANHVSAVKSPSKVKGVGTLLHKGKRTHLWNVDVISMEGRLVSTIRVLNSIIKVNPEDIEKANLRKHPAKSGE